MEGVAKILTPPQPTISNSKLSLNSGKANQLS